MMNDDELSTDPLAEPMVQTDVEDLMLRIREQIARQAFEVQSSTPEELADYTKKQIEFWTQLIRDMNIEPAG